MRCKSGEHQIHILLAAEIVDVRSDGDGGGLEATRAVVEDHAEDIAVAVFKVAEILCVSGAGCNASGIESAFAAGRAEIAFVRLLRAGADVTRVVRTRVHAVAATDANITIDSNRAILRKVSGPRRTGSHAGRA